MTQTLRRRAAFAPAKTCWTSCCVSACDNSASAVRSAQLNRRTKNAFRNYSEPRRLDANNTAAFRYLRDRVVEGCVEGTPSMTPRPSPVLLGKDMVPQDAGHMLCAPAMLVICSRSGDAGRMPALQRCWSCARAPAMLVICLRCGDAGHMLALRRCWSYACAPTMLVMSAASSHTRARAHASAHPWHTVEGLEPTGRPVPPSTGLSAMRGSEGVGDDQEPTR